MNEEAELDETNASLLTVPLGFTQLPLIDLGYNAGAQKTLRST